MTPRQSIVIFRRGKRIFGVGVVAYLLVNEKLAEYLWGMDENDESWPIVYILKEVRPISIDAKEINGLIGRKPNDNWQGMTSVAGPRADDVFHFVRDRLRSSGK